MGRYDEALRTGQWASKVLEAHAEWRSLAHLTQNLAIVYSRLQEDANALTLFDRAYELYSRLGPEAAPFLPWIDQNRATNLRNLGRFEDSIQASTTAWESLNTTGQHVEAARAHQNLAITLFMLGRYNDALALLNESREVFLADGRLRDAMRVDLFISDCLLQLRRFADVLECCQRARALFTELGTKLEVAQACLNKGVAQAGLLQYVDAVSTLAEARSLFTAEANPAWVAGTDLETAAILYRQGLAEESLAMAQACASAFRSYGIPVKEAQASVVAAQAAIALDRLVLARRLVAEAAAIGTRLDVPSVTFQCHHLLGHLQKSQGELSGAAVEYERAIQEVERLRGQLMVEYRAGFLEDKQTIYEDMVDLCLDQGQAHDGLAYAEHAKSRALTDLLAHRLDLGIRIITPTDRPVVEELTRLRGERDRLYRRWEGQEQTGDKGWAAVEESRQQARQEVLTLEKQITQLWHRLLVRNAGYASDASLWSVYAGPTRLQLPSDTLLVEYFLVHQQPVAFLITVGAVEARRLPLDISQVQRLQQLLWLNLSAVPGSSPTRSEASFQRRGPPATTPQVAHRATG